MCKIMVRRCKARHFFFFFFLRVEISKLFLRIKWLLPNIVRPFREEMDSKMASKSLKANAGYISLLYHS